MRSAPATWRPTSCGTPRATSRRRRARRSRRPWRLWRSSIPAAVCSSRPRSRPWRRGSSTPTRRTVKRSCSTAPRRPDGRRPAMTREIRLHNPPTLMKATGFSHGAEARGGRLLFFAGQVAKDKDGQTVGPGDLVAQFRQVCENLKTVVTAAGGGLTDVVKLTIYVLEAEARARWFSPVALGRLVLHERTWVPAMVPWRATEDGLVTQDVLDWYGRFAEGQPGVLVVEATGIRDIPSGPLLRIGDDRFLPGLRELVEVVRARSQGRTRF